MAATKYIVSHYHSNFLHDLFLMEILFAMTATMTILKHVFAAAIVLSLGACATRMPAVHSGFLSNYGALVYPEEGESAVARAAVPVDPARVVVADVQWRAGEGADISPDEQAALVAQLRTDLQFQFSRMPPNPGGRAASVRAAITRVATVSPALNAVSTVLLLAPVDRGGAAVEIEAIDAETHQQLAALVLGYYAPMSEFKARFAKLAPAELAVKKAARDFAPLLQRESALVP